LDSDWLGIWIEWENKKKEQDLWKCQVKKFVLEIKNNGKEH
jgi:hypothetical protein